MDSGVLIHYLDGNVVENPGQEEDFSEELERQFDLRLIAIQYPNSVIFRGEGYKILRDAYEQALCDTFDYRCEFMCAGVSYTVAVGEIKISDIEWNLNKCEADVKIADDGFGARINNNKSIKVMQTATTSKNGVSIGACPAIDLQVFRPTDPEPDYEPTTAVAYDWLEAMNHTVRFITDDLITVESPWYDALPEDERFCIVYGRELLQRDGSSLAPLTSFKDLFENMWKKYNLWAIVRRNASGNPVLSIVSDGDTFSPTVAVSFPNQDDLKQSVDLDRMYSLVKLGSEEAIKDEDNAHDLPFLPMVGFTEEEYYIEGVCNTDSDLDLVGKYIYDTNAITSVVISNDELNDKIFLIQYTVYMSQATKGDYLAPGTNPFLYNEALLNLNVANRWRLQAAGVQNYNAPDANFRAERTRNVTNPVFIGNDDPGPDFDAAVQMQFDDDYTPPNFDLDNTYGNGTAPGTPVTQADSRFTAPSTGYYVFQVAAPWRFILNTSDAGPPWVKTSYLRLIFTRYDSLSNVISTAVYDSPEYSITGFYSFTAVHPTIMNLNDYVEVESQLVAGSAPVGAPIFNEYATEMALFEGAIFETIFVAVGGGEITGSDADEYKTVIYKFDRSIPVSQWVTLRDDPTQAIQVSTDQTSFRTGYVSKVSRNVITGSCEWELIADRNQPFK